MHTLIRPLNIAVYHFWAIDIGQIVWFSSVVKHQDVKAVLDLGRGSGLGGRDCFFGDFWLSKPSVGGRMDQGAERAAAVGAAARGFLVVRCVGVNSKLWSGKFLETRKIGASCRCGGRPSCVWREVGHTEVSRLHLSWCVHQGGRWRGTGLDMGRLRRRRRCPRSRHIPTPAP